MGTLRALARGAVAGTVATLAMSAVMLAAERMGWMGREPPEVITEDALEAVGLEPSKEMVEATAAVAHLAFGAGAGAVYAVAVELLHLPARLLAVPYALGIWVTAYAGWVPALGIMPPAQRDRAGRPESMIAAHLVFGAVLGWALGNRPRADA